jgi:hypothetical protein
LMALLPPQGRERAYLSSIDDRKQAERIEKIASEVAASSSAPEWLRQILDAIVPAFTVSIRMLNKASPYIFAVAGGVYKFYTGLSSNMSTALYGFALSFFGGSFPVAIAVRIV